MEDGAFEKAAPVESECVYYIFLCRIHIYSCLEAPGLVLFNTKIERFSWSIILPLCHFVWQDKPILRCTKSKTRVMFLNRYMWVWPTYLHTFSLPDSDRDFVLGLYEFTTPFCCTDLRLNFHYIIRADMIDLGVTLIKTKNVVNSLLLSHHPLYWQP